MNSNIKDIVSNIALPVLITTIIFVIFKYAFWIAFPFIFAFLVAYVIRKIVFLLVKVTGLKVKEASFALLVLCYALLFATLYLLFNFLIGEAISFGVNIPRVYQLEIEPFISMIVSGSFFQNKLTASIFENLKNAASSTLMEVSTKIASIAIEIPNILITITVSIIASFFLCVDYDNIKNSILGLLSANVRAKLSFAKRNISDSIFKIFKSYLLIFLITFIELALGLVLLRVRYCLIIALMIAFADFLPLIGTGTILIPWGIISFIEGETAFAIGIMTLYLIIAVIRNIIEPKILGKNIGIHPLLTLAAMYIGLRIGGFLLAFILPITLLFFKSTRNNCQI